MDPISLNLEFFDYKNVTEEEIKEIQEILKGPESNGCVELPWEIPEIGCDDISPDEESVTEDTTEAEEEKEPEAEPPTEIPVTLPPLPAHIPPPPTHIPPPHIPPPPHPAVEPFVTLPTTVGYPNASYFMSRTIPYLRAYPPMGMPFFACPIQATGDAAMAASYGQFVPMMPPAEKYHIQTDTNNRNSAGRRPKKKYPSESYDSDTMTQSSDKHVPVSAAVSASPSSVPLVPLPVPPSTFTVAGGTLPMHGYPPGLHTLPYTQMTGQAGHPSAAMYYVPVQLHPYGSYIQSPPSAPMVMPMNLQPPQTEFCPLQVDRAPNDNFKGEKSPDGNVDNHPPTQKVFESNEEMEPVPQECFQSKEADDSVTSEYVSESSPGKDADDEISSQDTPPAKSPLPELTKVTNDRSPSLSGAENDLEEMNEGGNGGSRCWADLFKKPQVNGIDRPTNALPNDITNGKPYPVPVRDSVH